MLDVMANAHFGMLLQPGVECIQYAAGFQLLIIAIEDFAKLAGHAVHLKLVLVALIKLLGNFIVHHFAVIRVQADFDVRMPLQPGPELSEDALAGQFGVGAAEYFAELAFDLVHASAQDRLKGV